MASVGGTACQRLIRVDVRIYGVQILPDCLRRSTQKVCAVGTIVLPTIGLINKCMAFRKYSVDKTVAMADFERLVNDLS